MAKELTLAELQKQIEELQAKATLIIEVEKAEVIKEMKEKISLYKLTFKDLGFKAPEPLIVASTAPEKGKNTGKGTAPKNPMYRNKDNELETWKGGKGALPLWLKALADKHLSDKKVKNDKGNMIVPYPILKKWLDENGYKIPEPVAPVVAEEKK